MKKREIIIEDSFSDFVNYKCSSLFLIISALVVAFMRYFGESIKCWAIEDYKKITDEFTYGRCLYGEFLFLKIQNKTGIFYEKIENDISFVNVSSYLLGIQAFLFFIPHIFWKHCFAKCKINLEEIIFSVKNSKDIHLNSLNIKFCLDKTKSYGFGPISSCYLIILYFITKLAYLSNIIIQLLMIKNVMGTDTFFFGVKVFMKSIFYNKWILKTKFPSIVVCPTNTYYGKETYNIQCILYTNAFLEKMYSFINLWITVVGLITLLSLLKLGFRIMCTRYRHESIKSYLKMLQLQTEICGINYFISNLSLNGIFIINLIAINCGSILAAQIVEELWHQHIKDIGDCELKHTCYETNSEIL